MSIAPLAQGTHPATSTGPVDSPEPEPPCKHVLGRSLAHSNASPSIFVPSHMPGLSFPLPPPPHPVLLSAGQPAACPFEETAIRASAVFLPASAVMPCYGCAVPVTQTQPMAKLEHVRQRWPCEGRGGAWRSLEAPEPSSPRENHGEILAHPWKGVGSRESKFTLQG